MKSLFYLATLVLSLSSCKRDWLDIKPKQDLAVPSTFKDFQALLDNNQDVNMIRPALHEISASDIYLTNDNFNIISDAEKNAYTWTNNLSYKAVTDWFYSYKRVFVSNVILEGLSKIHPQKPADQTEWDNIRGQALFTRAMSFYELAQQYAPPYDVTTAANDLGIPLRLNSNINDLTVRSSLKDTYSQIISDLNAAKDLLPDNAQFLTRPSKSALLALLARVYLSIEDYVNAEIYSNACLAIKSNLLNFNNLDLLSSNPLPLLNKEVIYDCVLENYLSLILYGLIDSSFYSSYHDNDLRKQAYYVINSDSTISFRGSYQEDILLFSGLAIDEMYLIRAECYARAGDKNLALADLNKLLQTRWVSGTFQPFTANNSTEALTLILNERRKELILRGSRWSDLRRLNKDSRFRLTLNRTVNGVTYSLLPNSSKYTFPIPADIIQQTGIQQNIGW